MKTREALVIYNPSSGTQVDIDHCVGAVVHNLCVHGDYQVTVRNTVKNFGHKDVTQLISAGSYDLVAAAGGDGTIRLVLGAASEACPNTPVALIPLGTGNQLARNLKLYEDTLLSDPLLESIKVMLYGIETRIDLGVMNGEYFCVAAGAGPLSDAVIGPSKQDKANLKMLAYVGSIIQRIAAPPVNFRVQTGDDDFQVSASGIFVTNVSELGVGTLSGTAELNDGLLDLCIITPAEFGDYLELGFHFSGGLLGGDAPYYIRKVKSVKVNVVPIESQLSDFQAMAHKVRTAFRGESDDPPTYKEVIAAVDGDSSGTTPMNIEVRPSAVNVLTPRLRP